MTTEINTVHLNCVSLLVMATICSLAFIRNTGSRLRVCWPTLKLRPKNKRIAVRLLSPAIYRRALAQVKTTMDLGTKNHVKKQPRKTRTSTNVLCREISLDYHVTSWRKTCDFTFKLKVSGYVGDSVGWPLHLGVVRFADQHNFMKKLLKPMVYNKTQSPSRPVFCFSP